MVGGGRRWGYMGNVGFVMSDSMREQGVGRLSIAHDNWDHAGEDMFKKHYLIYGFILTLTATCWAEPDVQNESSLELNDPLGVVEEEMESAESEEGNHSDPTASVKYTDL